MPPIKNAWSIGSDKVGTEAQQDMSEEQKPVAWLWKFKDDGEEGLAPFMFEPECSERFDVTPLYTHPQKELTDDEIFKVANDYANAAMSVGGGMKTCVPLEIGFARAILKAASG